MSDLLSRIHAILAGIDRPVIACSGGIDSTLLATVAHRHGSGDVLVVHAVSPAVPPEATERVRQRAETEGWTLSVVQSGEFADENYLSNPVNRCYFCKSNLYASLQRIGEAHGAAGTILSGANVDDLGEYRPGLDAAAERGVRHPWIEAGFTKAEIRALARELELPFAELPASPCLASRLYTGTRVTEKRLNAIHACEQLIRRHSGLEVVRCRIRGDAMLIELEAGAAPALDQAFLEQVGELARSIEPEVRSVSLDLAPYRPGRAFVGAA